MILTVVPASKGCIPKPVSAYLAWIFFPVKCDPHISWSLVHRASKSSDPYRYLLQKLKMLCSTCLNLAHRTHNVNVYRI